jgi:hypothetical protein
MKEVKAQGRSYLQKYEVVAMMKHGLKGWTDVQFALDF